MLNSKSIGGKITAARKKMNLSQADLARQVSISSQAVGKWERGESMPDITTLNRVAEILGVDLNYFSESFQASGDDASHSESAENQTGKLPPGRIKNKISWDMSRGNWADADFSGLNNLHEKFSSSNMQRCRFNGSDLSGLILKTNNVENCDFSGSDLSNSHIQRSNLHKNTFRDCTLRGAEFSASNVEFCDFSGADFTDVKFSRSNMYGCDLSGADFTGAAFKACGFTGMRKPEDLMKNTIVNARWNRTSFNETHVADLVFTGILEDCYFQNCEFTRVTFQDVTLLHTFFKNNDKLKRIRFINCQADRMTYEFLKQGKAELSGITLLTQ